MIKIDPLLKKPLPPLRASAYRKLKESIQKEGLKEPLVVWKADKDSDDLIILEGHERYRICQELGIEPKIVMAPDYIITFDDAQDYVMAAQLANGKITETLDKDAFKVAVGRRHNLLNAKNPGISKKYVSAIIERGFPEKVVRNNGTVTEQIRARLGKFYGKGPMYAEHCGVRVRDKVDPDPILQDQISKRKSPGYIAASKRRKKKREQSMKQCTAPLRGLGWARRAIDSMSRIENGDPERKAAWALLRKWLDENEEKKKIILAKESSNFEDFIVPPYKEVKGKKRMLQNFMEASGFDKSKPVIVKSREDGKYEVVDGKHLFDVAKKLGIPFWYKVDDFFIDSSETEEDSVGEVCNEESNERE